jgi:hypothetical protein
MLPYPHGSGFMRKHKDSKKFVWWPAVYGGLCSYYESLGSICHNAEEPLSTENLKDYPTSGWTVASGEYLDEYMPYVITPEQSLLRLTDDDIYIKLTQAREMWSTGIP